MLVERYGDESIQLSSDGSFVLVRGPVRLSEEPLKEQMVCRYRIGSFLGREVRVFGRPGQHARLALRIPKELFHPRERLSVAVVASGENHLQKVLWGKRYEAGWAGSAPHLEPITDGLGEPPEETR